MRKKFSFQEFFNSRAADDVLSHHLLFGQWGNETQTWGQEVQTCFLTPCDLFLQRWEYMCSSWQHTLHSNFGGKTYFRGYYPSISTEKFDWLSTWIWGKLGICLLWSHFSENYPFGIAILMTVFIFNTENYIACAVSSATTLVLKTLICSRAIGIFENNLNIRQILCLHMCDSIC